MIEAILEILFEVLLQGGAELLIEVFSHKRRRKPPSAPMHPVIAGCLWLVLGAAIGGGSLLLFPHSFIHSPTLRLVNLVLTPLMLGAIMALVGRKRLANGQELVPLDRFSNAALFALGMGFVRYIWAA